MEKRLFTATLRIGPEEDYFSGGRVMLVGPDVLPLVEATLKAYSMPSKLRKELGRLVIDDFERNHSIDCTKPYRVVWGSDYVAELTLGDAAVVSEGYATRVK